MNEKIYYIKTTTPKNDVFIFSTKAEESGIMKILKQPNIAVFIIDQNDPIQRATLPPNAIPGFCVQVFKTDRTGKPKGNAIESFWAKWKDQAEQVAQEYHRQYGIMAAFNWK